jgi:hypothetical protein
MYAQNAHLFSERSFTPHVSVSNYEIIFILEQHDRDYAICEGCIYSEDTRITGMSREEIYSFLGYC